MELKKSAYPHQDVTYGRDWTDSEELIDRQDSAFHYHLGKDDSLTILLAWFSPLTNLNLQLLTELMILNT